MSKALSTTQGGNNNSRTVSESQNSYSKDDGFAEVEVDVNGDTNVLVEHDQLQMQSSKYLLEKIVLIFDHRIQITAFLLKTFINIDSNWSDPIYQSPFVLNIYEFLAPSMQINRIMAMFLGIIIYKLINYHYRIILLLHNCIYYKFTKILTTIIMLDILMFIVKKKNWSPDEM